MSLRQGSPQDQEGTQSEFMRWTFDFGQQSGPYNGESRISQVRWAGWTRGSVEKFNHFP